MSQVPDPATVRNYAISDAEMYYIGQALSVYAEKSRASAIENEKEALWCERHDDADGAKWAGRLMRQMNKSADSAEALLIRFRSCPITGKAECAERSCELHYTEAPVRLAPDVDCAVTLFTGRRYKEKYTHVVITLTSEISFDAFSRTQVHYASESGSDDVITVERLNMFYDEI